MSRLRLLFLGRFSLRPPMTGLLIRNQHLLRELGRHHDITFVSTAYDETIAQLKRIYGSSCEAVILVRYRDEPIRGVAELPDPVRRHAIAPLLEALYWLDTSSYDAAILDSIFMGAFRRHLHTRTVVSESNIESELLRQAGQEQQARDLASFETATWALCDQRWVVSEVDRSLMAQRTSGPILTVPNGADPQLWQPGIRQSNQRLLFMGALQYGPNVQGLLRFVARIWPLIRHRRPRLRLVVAGRDPAPEIQELSGRDGIQVVANPRHMGRVARACSMAIVPLEHGSGSRIKIPEAMMMGLPIISTSRGCEGLDVHDGDQLLIRNDCGDFASAVAELDADPLLWEGLRQRARQWAVAHHSWSTCFKGLDPALRVLCSTVR